MTSPVLLAILLTLGVPGDTPEPEVWPLVAAWRAGELPEEEAGLRLEALGPRVSERCSPSSPAAAATPAVVRCAWSPTRRRC